MTTLYRPVLIETPHLPMEQFPEGTIATHPDHDPVSRCSCSRWGPLDTVYDPDLVGWTALVPIEAEEEASRERSGVCTPACPRSEHSHPARTRLVTNWEDA